MTTEHAKDTTGSGGAGVSFVFSPEAASRGISEDHPPVKPDGTPAIPVPALLLTFRPGLFILS